MYSSYNLLDSVIAIRDVESKEIGKEKREREKKKRSIIIFVLVIIMEHDFSFCTYALFMFYHALIYLRGTSTVERVLGIC